MTAMGRVRVARCNCLRSATRCKPVIELIHFIVFILSECRFSQNLGEIREQE